MITTILAAFFCIMGGAWLLLTAMGLHKFKDFYYKIHVASQGPSLGIMLLLIGAAIHFHTPLVIFKCIAIAFFIFITVPVSASLIALTKYELDFGELKNEGEEIFIDISDKRDNA